MTIYYRLCNVKSPLSAPPPILEDDQFKLNVLCLNSFIMAFTGCDIKIVFICDFCPKELYEPILEQVPFEHEVIWTEKGINETALLQYELAHKTQEDVLFAECDFTWLPQSGQKIINAITQFGLFSPYDHLNFYIDRSIHSNKCEIELFENHHFRTVERNVMTFGMTSEVLKKNYQSLKRWGYLDNEIWKEMRVNGNKLWVALPAFATHMVDGFLAPGIDWELLWKILMRE